MRRVGRFRRWPPSGVVAVLVAVGEVTFRAFDDDAPPQPPAIVDRAAIVRTEATILGRQHRIVFSSLRGDRIGSRRRRRLLAFAKRSRKR
jgi:hypothetical protein